MHAKLAMLPLIVIGSFISTTSWCADTKPHVDTSGVNAQPPYPASALSDRESGAVVLAVSVNASGAVEKVSPVKTSGFEDLDKAAIAGVLSWRFVPATSDGKAIDGAALVQIVFNPPDDQSAQPAKTGVQADYLSSDFTLEAPYGNVVYNRKPLPCLNGSLSVSMQFVSVNIEPNSIDGDSTLAVAIGSGDSTAMIRTYPAYYPAHYQFVALAMERAKGDGEEMDRFRFQPNFHKPTVLNLSWTAGGQVIASVAGQKLPALLSAQPTTLSFSTAGGVGRFTDARLFCTSK